MRREADFFGEVELPLVYIAKKLRDALRIEEVLTGAGIDYLIETDTYRGGIIFVSERVGAFFYVAPQQEASARQAIQAEGFRPYAPNP
jgi:hypothetical protein